MILITLSFLYTLSLYHFVCFFQNLLDRLGCGDCHYWSFYLWPEHNYSCYGVDAQVLIFIITICNIIASEKCLYIWLMDDKHTSYWGCLTFRRKCTQYCYCSVLFIYFVVAKTMHRRILAYIVYLLYCVGLDKIFFFSNAFYGMTVNYLDNNGEYECKFSTQ